MEETNLKVKTKVKSKAARHEAIIGYMFLLPTIVGFSIFVAYPLISSVYYSLTEWTGVGIPKFVGLKNFKYLFTMDPTFTKSIVATILYVIYTVPIGLFLGLFLALLLNKTIPGIKLFRTLFYLPVILPSVATLVLWLFVFKTDYGLLNNILRSLHLPTGLWLESEKMALPSVAMVSFWTVGSTMIIFLSGLQSIPTEVYEAADIDGASSFRKFWKITFPMITPVFFLQTITGVIGAFQTFNQVAILTKGANNVGGGPNYSTYLLSYSIVDSAFNNQKFGYAIAQVWVLFIIIMIFTVIIFKFSEQFVYYENDNS